MIPCMESGYHLQSQDAWTLALGRDLLPSAAFASVDGTSVWNFPGGTGVRDGLGQLFMPLQSRRFESVAVVSGTNSVGFLRV